MNNIISRLLDRLRATQRLRQILINAGLFLLAVVAFLSDNPIFEIGEGAIKWVSALAFLANALAGIVAEPNRMVPVGYDLKEDGGIYSITKTVSSNWLSIIISVLRATDQIKSILVNVGLFIGVVIMFLVDESIIAGDMPKVIAAIAFLGNAFAGMANNPNRTIPDGFNLYQDTNGDYYISKALPADTSERSITTSAGTTVMYKF